MKLNTLQVKVSIISLFVCLSFTAAFAQLHPVLLDSTFNLTGKVREVFPHGPDDCYGMDVQADGKIVCAGNSIIDGEEDTSVARFNADGSPDTTFGNNGKITLTLSSGFEAATGVKIQPDGKIVTVGFHYPGTPQAGPDLALARFNPDGTLDGKFGKKGRTFIGGALGTSITMQPDGKIIVAGRYMNMIIVARYNTDGTLDTSFSGDGKATLQAGGTYSGAEAVAIQQDGKIVVSGDYSLSEERGFVIARFNSDGSPDLSLGGVGFVTITFPSNPYDFGANAVIAQPDGKIIAGGGAQISPTGSYVFTLVRVNSDGSLDPTFDGDGIVQTQIETFSHILGLASQPDGKILAGGFSINSDGSAAATIARYNTNGSLDPTFHGNGIVSLASFYSAASIKLMADGRIVAGVRVLSYGGDTDMAVARFLANGSHDNSLGGDGIATIDIGNQITPAKGVIVQPDGKIITTGTATNGTDDDFTLFRYNVDGTRDNSFGIAGKVQTGFDVGSVDDAAAVALQPDGKIVVVGTSRSRLALVRYQPDGMLDATFGSGGKVVTTIPYGGSLSSMAIQSDGKIVVAGSASFCDVYCDYFAVARYNINGSLDSTFGTNGIVITIIQDDYYHAAANALAIRADGKIVVAGSAYYCDEFDCFSYFAVARYNANGSPDSTFGTNGQVVGQGDYLASVLSLPDGKIVGAGGIRLVRFNPNGSLDTTFGVDGFVTLPLRANASQMDKNGKLVIAGFANNGSGLDFAVARLNADGTFDASFNGNGIFLFDFIGRKPDWATSLTFDPQRRIVVAGSGAGSLAVARLIP